MAFKSLQAFRESELFYDMGEGEVKRLGDVIAPFQKDRFLAWDKSSKVYCESCVGSSKSTDIAGWCISQFLKNPYTQGLIYACDRGQAARILEMARGFINRNRRLKEWCVVDRNRIKCLKKIEGVKAKHRMGEVLVEASDLAHAEGLIADFVILEQLESWRHEELWEAIASRSHKRKMKIIIIANACRQETDWQFRIRQLAIDDSEWKWFDINATDVPWITEKYLEKVKDGLLRPAAFERLFFNVVGSDDETMFTKDQVNDIIIPHMKPAIDVPKTIHRVVLSHDHGMYHDPACLTALGEQHNGDQVLLNMITWQGTPENPPDFRDIDASISQFWNMYRPVRFVYDPRMMEYLAQKYTQGSKILAEPFKFSSKSNDDLTRQLWRRVVDRRIQIYRGAGPSMRKGSLWDLEREMKTVRVLEDRYGCKLDTQGSATKDRVISLGMASWWLDSTYKPVNTEWVTVSEDDDYLGQREMQGLDF